MNLTHKPPVSVPGTGFPEHPPLAQRPPGPIRRARRGPSGRTQLLSGAFSEIRRFPIWQVRDITHVSSSKNHVVVVPQAERQARAAPLRHQASIAVASGHAPVHAAYLARRHAPCQLDAAFLPCVKLHARFRIPTPTMCVADKALPCAQPRAMIDPSAHRSRASPADSRSHGFTSQIVQIFHGEHESGFELLCTTPTAVLEHSSGVVICRGMINALARQQRRRARRATDLAARRSMWAALAASTLFFLQRLCAPARQAAMSQAACSMLTEA